MIPKINIKYLENDLYSIRQTQTTRSSISYFDFNYSPPVQTLNLSSYGTVGPNVYLKNIQLKKLEFLIDPYLNEYMVSQVCFETIKNEINKDAYKLITSLGEKNRLTAPTNITNFNIKELKEKYGDRFTKSVMSKFISICNYIASQGRIGPAQYVISNPKTYKYILSNLDTIDFTYDKNGNFFIDNGHTPYIVDNLVDDDVIIFGRKNKIDQSGVHCAILTDENNDIIFHKISSADTFTQQSKLVMYYEVFDVGVNPEFQFMKINTRTLAYYRFLKLKKIKELYGR